MRAPLFVVPVLVSFLAACGGGGGIDMPSAKDFPPPGAPPTTKVVQAGTAARVLRFAPKADAIDKVRADLQVTSSVSGGGQSMDVEMGFDLTTTNTVEEVKPDGSAKVRSVVDDAKVKVGGELASMGMDSSTISDMVKGIATIVEVDARGRLLGMNVEGGGGMMDQLQMGMDKSLSSGFIPLPEEAVGVGAEWDSLGHMDAMGVKAQLAARYKLIELNGSEAKLELTMRGKADAQRAQLPSAPVEVDLDKLDIEGSGTIKIDLERPTRGEADLTVRVKASMTAQGQSVDTTMTMRMKAAPIP